MTDGLFRTGTDSRTGTDARTGADDWAAPRPLEPRDDDCVGWLVVLQLPPTRKQSPVLSSLFVGPVNIVWVTCRLQPEPTRVKPDEQPRPAFYLLISSVLA